MGRDAYFSPRGAHKSTDNGRTGEKCAPPLPLHCEAMSLIGTEQFPEWIDRLHLKEMTERKRKEDVTLRRSMKHASEEQVLDILDQEMGYSREPLRARARDSLPRAISAHVLMKYAGHSQREVADFLNLRSGSSVSHQIRNLEDRLKGKRALQQRLKRVESILEKERIKNAPPRVVF